MSRYRIKNINNGNYVTKDISSVEAYKLCDRLNERFHEKHPECTCYNYEVVSVDEIEKQMRENIPSTTRLITEDETKGLNLLKEVKLGQRAEAENFINSLLAITGPGGNKKISEKQAAYLWHLIYHYRRQIGDSQLIKLAEQNRIY